MTTIVTRAGKGSPLTWNEGDANFNNLNAAVIAAQSTADSALVAATTTFTDVAIGVVPASGGGTTNYLRADGTFAAPPGAGASPGGADTQVQFNDGGSFGGDSVLTWNKTTNVLSVDRVVVTPTSANDGIAITGAAASIGLKITQGASAGTALSLTDSTAASTLNFQPGTTTSYITYSHPISFYCSGADRLILGTDGNIGVKVAGNAWGSGHRGITLGYSGNNLYGSATNGQMGLANNAYYDGANWKYANTALCSLLDLSSTGNLSFYSQASGTAGTNITLTNMFSVSDTGVLSAKSDVQIDGVSVRTIPQNSQSAAYTLVAGDAGKHILHPSADTTARVFTIPANGSVAFPIGTAVTFVNQASAGVITISITTDTMRLAGAGTTGSRTLAANGIATALKITSTEWIISGTGLT